MDETKFDRNPKVKKFIMLYLTPVNAIFKQKLLLLLYITRICHNDDNNDNNKEIDIQIAQIIILISQNIIY